MPTASAERRHAKMAPYDNRLSNRAVNIAGANAARHATAAGYRALNRFG